MSRLRDIADLRSDKVQPSDAQDSTYIGLEHIQQQTLALSGVGMGADVSSQKQRFYRGDVLFGKLRPYFRKVILAREEGICSTDIWVVRPKDEADSAFILYLLASQEFIEEATNTSEGSRMPRANWRVMSDYEFPDFTAHERVKIGEFLSLFDEKIKENRHASALLEKTSQSLFKSWFIDFDPVKAKMAVEEPVGMDAETAALFPDSMEDSELGEIPAGWSVGTLVDFFNLVMGQSPPGSAYNSEGVGEPFFQGRAEFGERFPSQRLSSTLGNRRATKGDVLVSVRAPVGDQNQALVDCIIGRGLAAIRHKSGSQAYSYEFVRSIQGQLDFFNGQGSVFGSISKRDFESLQVLEPPDALIQAFDSICSPNDELLRNLHVQNESLAGIRDALLSRLISGELKIPDETLAEL